MEVEDMIVNETSNGADRTNYYTAENEEMKEPIGPSGQLIMPSFGSEEIKESIKNSPPSHDNPNYLENAAGSSS